MVYADWPEIHEYLRHKHVNMSTACLQNTPAISLPTLQHQVGIIRCLEGAGEDCMKVDS